MPPKTAKSRKRLTLQEKLEALQMLETGVPSAVVMDKFKVSSRFITKLRSERDELRRIAEEDGRTLTTKTRHKAGYPDIELKVFRFCEIARFTKLPVTQDLIRERALLVRESLLKGELSAQDRVRFEKFTASIGWCQNFVKRHCLSSHSLSGQGGTVTYEEVAEEMSEFRKRLSSFDVEHVYNVDETGLFYKLLPRRTYILSYENKKTLRGTKAMGAKDRITAYVCTNADGSQKLPMAIIGKAAKPRCFRLGAPAVPYFSNSTAWSNTGTFRKWFNYVFLPHVRKVTSKPVALVVDNASSHNELKDMRGQVSVIDLPPNVTALHQPMDMGVIYAFKRLYRRAMLRELVRDIESRSERREANHKNPGGMNGIAEGYEPHMLDVTRLVKQSWESVSQMTIARCWMKARCLPSGMNAELNSTFGRMRNSSRSDEVMELVDLLGQLRIGADDSDPLQHDIDKDVSERDMERWVNIEADDDVTSAFCADMVDAIERDEAEDMVEEAAGTADDDEMETEIVAAELPSLVSVCEMFREAQQTAFNCNLADASAHLHRALNSFREAIRAKNRSASRQLLVPEMMRRRPRPMEE